jgi:DNA primase
MRNVLNLLQEFGIHVKFVGTYDRGDTYHSACPRSGCSKENGFHVWPGENSGAGAWWCRGCGKGGDGIQFLRDYRGLSFKDACNALDISKTDYQTLPKIEHKKPEFQPKSAALPEEKWQEKAKILIGFCHMKLLKNEAQLAWLKKRGISKDAVIKYQLGWNEKAIWRARSAWGLSEEKNKDGKIKALFISAGLIIPVMHKGTVYKINIRRGPDHSPPYLPIAGSKNTPLMLGSITKGCVVVETHLDGFMLNEMIGDLAGVLVLGTVDAKPTDLQTGRLKKAVCILVALDFDGRPGGKASKWWAEHFPRSRRWPVPTGKDPGEALEKGLDIRECIL